MCNHSLWLAIACRLFAFWNCTVLASAFSFSACTCPVLSFRCCLMATQALIEGRKSCGQFLGLQLWTASPPLLLNHCWHVWRFTAPCCLPLLVSYFLPCACVSLCVSFPSKSPAAHVTYYIFGCRYSWCHLCISSLLHFNPVWGPLASPRPPCFPKHTHTHTHMSQSAFSVGLV